MKYEMNTIVFSFSSITSVLKKFSAMRFDRNRWSWKLKQKVKWKRSNNSQKYQITTLHSIRTVIRRTDTVYSHMRLHMNASLFSLSFFFFFIFVFLFFVFSTTDTYLIGSSTCFVVYQLLNAMMRTWSAFFILHSEFEIEKCLRRYGETMTGDMMQCACDFDWKVWFHFRRTSLFNSSSLVLHFWIRDALFRRKIQ